MRDTLYFIFYLIMGIIGLACYFLLTVVLIFYYPIWLFKNCGKEKKRDRLSQLFYSFFF